MKTFRLFVKGTYPGLAVNAAIGRGFRDVKAELQRDTTVVLVGRTDTSEGEPYRWYAEETEFRSGYGAIDGTLLWFQEVSDDSDSPRPAEPKTVQDLFTTHFQRSDDVQRMTIRGGETIPLDSPCGSDCEKAIMAGVSLLTHAKAMYGEDDVIADVVIRICEVYING